MFKRCRYQTYIPQLTADNPVVHSVPLLFIPDVEEKKQTVRKSKQCLWSSLETWKYKRHAVVMLLGNGWKKSTIHK